MKPLDKHPYEPPVVEVFELRTENILLPASQTRLGGTDSYEPINDENILPG